jgi:hypothetical protein
VARSTAQAGVSGGVAYLTTSRRFWSAEAGAGGRTGLAVVYRFELKTRVPGFTNQIQKRSTTPTPRMR